jgi:hypothetical protein
VLSRLRLALATAVRAAMFLFSVARALVLEAVS